MNQNEIKEYLLDFQKKKLPDLIKRDLAIGETKKIKSIIGPRRAGKTYFLYQKMKELLDSGIKMEDIVYLNFENPRLIEVGFKDVKEIIKLHWQLYPDSIKKRINLFIDEPQNVKNWEIAVRGLYEEGFNIFLTGSSSKLLSKEIATSLRGRTLSYALLPFSFKEFLKTKGIVFEILRLSSKEKSLLLSFLDGYLEFGSFPEVVLEENKENKLRIINSYFELVVYRDIVERYKIKNTRLIRWLIKSLASSFSKEFSVNKVYLTLKSKGIKLSKNTLYSYLSMLEDSFFVFFLPKFELSIRKKEFSINKAYLCDLGFTKLIEITKDKGKRMENAVFLELQRIKGPLTNFFYWKDLNSEVDFVVKEGLKVKQLIQVCSNLTGESTRKREIRGLLQASKKLKCRNLLILTEEDEKETEEEWFGIKRKVKFIPLWKWLLEK
jgi:predicted AAA+ superfamily ATPase